MCFNCNGQEKKESIGTADIGNGYFHLKFDIANASECDNTQFEDENKKNNENSTIRHQ